MNQRHNYDHDDNASRASFKIAFIGFLLLLAIVLGIKAASANTINLPIVSQSKREPTITPWGSVGGPWVGPTQTPTVTPPPMVQP